MCNFHCKHPVMAVVLSLLVINGSAQGPGKKLTPEEIKTFDMGTQVENILDKFTPAEKAEGKERAQLTAAYFMKGVLYRSDKTKYPIDQNSNALEKISADLVNDLPLDVFNRIKGKVEAAHGDPQVRAKLLGKYAGLDLTKPTLAPQIKKISGLEIKPARRTMSTLAMAQYDRSSFNGPVATSTLISETKAPAPKFMDLVLRAVHCVDETNPEGSSDEMVMSALLIGASGNTNNARGLDCGDYDDGTYRSFGFYPFGSYSMSTTSAYPKVFYAILQMVEVDTDEEDMIRTLNQVLYSIGATIASAWGLGAIVVAVGEAVDLILGWLIDDDAMNVYGIQMTMNSQSSLKVNGNTVNMSGGSSSNWHTGNITGHGGTYRIGFRCQLRN